MDDDDDPHFREFLHEMHEALARESELAHPNFKHTPGCVEAKRVWKERDREWMARWPNFCHFCGGFGSFIGYEDAFPCEGCSEKNLCARCGATLPNDGEWPFAVCGFDGDPQRPDEPAYNCSGDGKTERRHFRGTLT